MKKIALPILLLVWLCGCTSLAEKAQDELKYGMSQEDVIASVGEPSRKLDRQWYYATDDGDFILNFDADGKYERIELSQPTGPAAKSAEAKDTMQKTRDIRQSWSTQEGIRNYQ